MITMNPIIEMNNDTPLPPPKVAIGGVGGSGTRVIARLIEGMGLHLGLERNEAADSLWFTYLFKRPSIRTAPSSEFQLCCDLLAKGILGNSAFNESELMFLRAGLSDAVPHLDGKFVEHCIARNLEASRESRALGEWGWKEPNTHIVIDRLLSRWPKMKYIHVIRDGRYMAFSRNKNQVKMWGTWLMDEAELIKGVCADSPALALEFWFRANQRIDALADQLDERILSVRYEDLCEEPLSTATRIASFVGLPLPWETDAALRETLGISLPRNTAKVIHALRPTEQQNGYLEKWGYV